MASSRKELEELHKLLTKSLTGRIQQDINDNLPTDAATLSAAIKFLKDNEVTADPADKEDLLGLRGNLVEIARKRREAKDKTLALVKDDLKVMEG